MHANVVLLGRLGSDPEIRYLQDATAVANVSLAVDKPRWGEEPDWWRLTIWGELAEFAAENLAKGCRVMVEGRPGLDEWVDANGGHHARLGCTVRVLRVIDWADHGAEGVEPTNFSAPSEAPAAPRGSQAPPQPSPAQRARGYRPTNQGRSQGGRG